MFLTNINHKKLSQILGYEVIASSLKRIDCSGRIDLIGDRALSLAVTTLLYEIYTDEPVGILNDRMVRAISNKTLYFITRKLGLNAFVYRCGQKHMADTLEAIMGLIFLECSQDIEIIKWFIIAHWPYEILQLDTKIINRKFQLLVKKLCVEDDYDLSICYKQLRLALKSSYISDFDTGKAISTCSENISLLKMLLESREISKNFFNEALKSFILENWEEGFFVLLSHGANPNAVVQYRQRENTFDYDDSMFGSDILSQLETSLCQIRFGERIEGKIYRYCYSEVSILQLAILEGRSKKVIEELLKYNSDPNWNKGLNVLVEDPFALRVSITFGEYLRSGQRPRDIKRITDLSTSLHYAYHRKELVELLLRYKANPNFQDENGDTPLHLECRTTVVNYFNEGHIENNEMFEVVYTLIDGGADIHKKNSRGFSALDVICKTPVCFCWLDEFTVLAELVEKMQQKFYWKSFEKYSLQIALTKEYSIWKEWSYRRFTNCEIKTIYKPT